MNQKIMSLLVILMVLVFMRAPIFAGLSQEEVDRINNKLSFDRTMGKLVGGVVVPAITVPSGVVFIKGGIEDLKFDPVSLGLKHLPSPTRSKALAVLNIGVGVGMIVVGAACLIYVWTPKAHASDVISEEYQFALVSFNENQEALRRSPENPFFQHAFLNSALIVADMQNVDQEGLGFIHEESEALSKQIDELPQSEREKWLFDMVSVEEAMQHE